VIGLRYLQVVVNSHVGGAAPPVAGGGGVPRRPSPPRFIGAPNQ
jgi:hypothetical protein